GTQRKLTFDRKGVGSPRWSPSGDRLAFLATAGSGDKAAPQVFVLDMRGGEARQITEAANGVEQYAWKPDGADIAYVTPDDAENKKEIEAHNDAFEVGDDGYLTTAAPTPSHLWMVPVGGGTARRLTHGAWSLAKSQPPGPPSSPLAWSPDGKSLLLGGHDGTRTVLWLVPLGGAAKRIDLGEVSPAWGFWIDVSVGKDGAITFAGSTPDRPTELYYLASAAAPPRRLTD